VNRIAYALAGFELVALAAHFVSLRLADLHIPGYGGEGDAVAFFLWSDRAGLAFWLLTGLWLLALVRFASQVLRGDGRNVLSVLAALGTADTLAIGIPVYGLFLGYVIRVAFG
jgi:hypothetical protein